MTDRQTPQVIRDLTTREKEALDKAKRFEDWMIEQDCNVEDLLEFVPDAVAEAFHNGDLAEMAEVGLHTYVCECVCVCVCECVYVCVCVCVCACACMC